MHQGRQEKYKAIVDTAPHDSYFYESEMQTVASSRPPSQSMPRRLPLPPTPESKRISRPLPKIPQLARPLACKQCNTCITSDNFLLPQSAVCVSMFCSRHCVLPCSSDSSRFAYFQGLFGQSFLIYGDVSLSFTLFETMPLIKSLGRTSFSPNREYSLWPLGRTLCRKSPVPYVLST